MSDPDDDDATLDPALDLTVNAAARPSADRAVERPGETEDATVVAAREEPARSPSPGARAAVSSPLAEYMRTASKTGAGATGLDPERRIAEVPDRMPWEAEPRAEAGLRPGLPVVYGPRAGEDPETWPIDDEIRLRLGSPPGSSPVPLREGREELPSLARRERRRRAFTLAGYGVAVVVAALGLWAIARLALG